MLLTCSCPWLAVSDSQLFKSLKILPDVVWEYCCTGVSSSKWALLCWPGHNVTSNTTQLQKREKIDRLNSKCHLGNVPFLLGLLYRSAALPLSKPVNWRHAREGSWLGWFITWTVARCDLYSDFIGYSVVMEYSVLEETYRFDSWLNSKYFHLLWSFSQFLTELISMWTCAGVSLSWNLVVAVSSPLWKLISFCSLLSYPEYTLKEVFFLFILQLTFLRIFEGSAWLLLHQWSFRKAQV